MILPSAALFYAALEQSLLFFPLALGIYLSYSLLRTTDMTIEGSFVLGAGVFARLFTLQINPFLSSFLAIALGGLSGIGVGWVQAKGKIPSLMAGIIALFMLYALNFHIMGRPNISLYQCQLSLFWLILIVTILMFSIIWLIASPWGLSLRALGVNAPLLTTLGKKTESYRFFGLALSNALAALCGVITAIGVGYADLNMGFGMALTGIAMVILGKKLLKVIFPRMVFHAGLEICSCFLGVYFYFLIMNGFLSLGLDPIYLKFLLGLILILLLRGKRS